MTRLIALVLFSLVVRPVPPIIVIPPHYHELGWREWNAYVPPVNALKPPLLAPFYRLDQEVCVAGPAQPAEFPNVLRCVGLI